jgi:hypothetical protein
MTLSLQEISDRLEIQETITRYSHGLDQRLWDQWDLAFAPDAILDFSHVGLREFTIPEAIEYFSPPETKRITGQHLLSNTLITLHGDTATARSEFTLFTAAWVDQPGGKANLNSGGGWYDDELRRTEAGWRITRRTAHMKWIKQDTIDWNVPGR